MRKSIVNFAALGALALSVLSLSGCATVEGYRQRMDLLTGKTADMILVEWGTPISKADLSDGSELWVYERETENRSGGYWTTQSRTRTEHFVVDGKKKTRTVTYSEPYYEPVVVTRSFCETRFVMGTDHRVKQVSFEGDGCVAEELKKPQAAN